MAQIVHQSAVVLPARIHLIAFPEAKSSLANPQFTGDLALPEAQFKSLFPEVLSDGLGGSFEAGQLRVQTGAMSFLALLTTLSQKGNIAHW